MPYDPTTGVQSGKKPPIATSPKEPVTEPGSGSPANQATDKPAVISTQTPPIVAQPPAPTQPEWKQTNIMMSRPKKRSSATGTPETPPQAQPLPGVVNKPAVRPGAAPDMRAELQPFNPVDDLQKQMGDPNSRFNKMSRDEVLSMVPWLKNDPNFANMSDGDLRFLAGQHIGQQIKSGDMGAAANWAGQLQAIGGGYGGANPSVEKIAKGFRGNIGVDPGWNIEGPGGKGAWGGGMTEWGGFTGMGQMPGVTRPMLGGPGGQMPGGPVPGGGFSYGGPMPVSNDPYRPPQMAGPSQGNSPVQQMPPPPQGGWQYQNPQYPPQLNEAIGNLNNPDWVRQQQELLAAAQGAQGSYLGSSMGYPGRPSPMQNIAPQTRQPGMNPFNPVGVPQRGPRMQQF